MSNDMTSNTTARRRAKRDWRKKNVSNGVRMRDEGGVLPMTLIFSVMSALVVIALLTWVATVIRVRPPLEERTSVSEAVRSGIRMSINQQRVYGPDGCYDDVQPVSINSYTVTLTCQVDGTPDYDNPLMRGRFGIITTSHTPTVPGISGIAGGETKLIDGEVFINGGQVDVNTADLEFEGTPYGSTFAYPTPPDTLRYNEAATDVDCLTVGATAYGTGLQCLTEDWTTRAGYNPTGTAWVYPDLPPVPTQTRNNQHILDIGGGCTVYFPGRYQAPLNLNGGDHYFASGVYLFEQPITISNDAEVVFGEGHVTGCALDAEAALFRDDGPPVIEAPSNHTITGKGATLLLADQARFNVDNSHVTINRRLSSPQNRATEGTSIRVVETADVATDELTVPADQVMIDPGDETTPPTREPSATHAISGLSYTSNDADWDEAIVDIDFRGGPVDNMFRADGAIFVPTAAVRVQADDDAYGLRVSGGITASTVALEMTQIPANEIEDYVFGSRTGIVQNKFRLLATVDSNGILSHSTAELQLHQNGSYAVNNWVLDLNGTGGSSTGGTSTGGTTTGGTTTGGTTTGGTTTGGTTTGGTTTGGTTTGGTTTGGTTTGGTTGGGGAPFDFCGTNGGAWTNDFGPGDWQAEYWDNQYLDGTPDVTVAETEVKHYWDGGGPGSPIPDDYFSARWTKTVDLTAPCDVTFRVGADDGFRAWVNGQSFWGNDHWYPHGHFDREHEVSLGIGQHTIVVEFYELGGWASTEIEWKSGHAAAPPFDFCDTNTGSFTYDFGPGDWTVEYWNNTNLSGTPDYVTTVNEVREDWGYGGPGNGINNNYFSARWTKTIDLTNPCNVRFRVGGDDGFRASVDGNSFWGNNYWYPHGYFHRHKNVNLSAGQHTIVMEFYEQAYDAEARLRWKKRN